MKFVLVSWWKSELCAEIMRNTTRNRTPACVSLNIGIHLFYKSAEGNAIETQNNKFQIPIFFSLVITNTITYKNNT